MDERRVVQPSALISGQMRYLCVRWLLLKFNGQTVSTSLVDTRSVGIFLLASGVVMYGWVAGQVVRAECGYVKLSVTCTPCRLARVNHKKAGTMLVRSCW